MRHSEIYQEHGNSVVPHGNVAWSKLELYILGLYYLIFLLLEKFYLGGRLGPVASHIYTLLVILFGWTIFRFESLSELGTVLAGMFWHRYIGICKYGTWNSIPKEYVLHCACVCSLYRYWQENEKGCYGGRQGKTFGAHAAQCVRDAHTGIPAHNFSAGTCGSKL